MTAAPFSEEMLRRRGYVGFVRAQALHADGCAEVPREPGTYVVLRTAESAPEILTRSKGGWFKGKDPSVAPDRVRARLIEGSQTLYIGKADQLHRRVRQLLDFGNGRPVGHYGGRLLWQIGDSDDYLVAWKVDTNPRAAESDLLAEFEDEFGTLPFANLVR